MTVISTTISAADANSAPGFSGSPSSGTTRVTISNGSPEAPAALPDRGSTAQDYSTVTRISSADIGAGNELQAVSATGRPLAPSEIKPDSLVTINGQTLKAALAERLGFITRDASGYRINAAAAPVSAPQSTQQTRSDEGAASPAPALPEAAAASLEALNAGGQDTHSAAVEYLDSGALSASATARLAGRLGIEPEAVAAHVSNVAEGFRSQAASLVGGSEVLDLAAHLEPALADRVARDHALKGDVSGYAALAAKATDHVISNAVNVESTDADIRVRTISGKHLVSGPGIPGEIDLRQAVRLGFVSVTVQR